MMMAKSDIVRLPSDLVAACEAWAAETVAHYMSGDPKQAMPWTQDQFTQEEIQRWLASRKEAGRSIDIETCEIGCWGHPYDDPYWLGVVGDDGSDKSNFVRSPESNGWVFKCDLPMAKARALYDRIKREDEWSEWSASLTEQNA
jgi:hypothetical protein